MAWAKLNEAKCLFENGYYNWSYYTAGYTIELMLKAAVCKALEIENLYEENSRILKAFKYPQTFKTHNFEQLLMLSGVYISLKEKLAVDVAFKANWLIVCDWS